jgi:hypothetical protein
MTTPNLIHPYDSARSAATDHRWLAPTARAGYVAKGILYLTVGVLALLVASGAGGELTDERGALVRLGDTAFGAFIVGLTGIGLVAYTIWQLIRAIFDPEHPARDEKSALRRVGYLASAIVHGGLAVAAWGVLMRDSSHSSGQRVIAPLTESTLGVVLLVVAGFVLLGFGVYQLVRAYKVQFRDELETARMSEGMQKWSERLGRFGYAARGVVFGLVGASLVVAGVTADPSDARGIDGVLADIAVAPFGRVMLALVAAGLAAYGIFMFVYARYRRIPA